MKVCTKCKSVKSDDSFYFDSARRRLHSWCKACQVKASSKYLKENREKYAGKYIESAKLKPDYKENRKKNNEKYYSSENGKNCYLKNNRKYYSSEKGKLSILRKRLAKAKKESTKQKIIEQINIINTQINNNNL